jgi:protein O-GlcNAc transferase
MIASGNSSKTKSNIAAKNNKKTAKPNFAEMNALATLFNQGKLVESEPLAIQMTQRFPRHGFGWKVLGAIHLQQGIVDEAFHALNMAAEFLPNDSEAQYNLGNCFYDQGQLNEAVVCYKKSIMLAPGFAKAHYNLGNVFKNQDFLEQAKESYKKALKIEPNNVQIACNLAHVLYEQELFSEAISYFEQALQRQKDFTAAHVGLGAAFQAVGRLAEAEECFRKALNGDPNDVDSHNNLGGLFKVLGRFSEAESCYRAALIIAPESADTYIKLGSLLKDMGKGTESLFCYTKALNIDPLREEIQNDLGLALAEQGRFNEAEVYYQNALKIAPNYWKAYNNLGLSLYSMGRFTEAEAAFEKAIELNPNEALVFSNLSLPLVAQGQIKKAEISLKKAIEIAPAYVNAYINLGTNYLAQGLAQEAESAFLQALALEPDSTKAKSNLLFTMNYLGGHSADYRLGQACQYDRIVADKVGDVFTTWQPVSQVKRLRIGLVSGDLRQHPVAYFLENWAQYVDSSRVELIAYLTDVREDTVTHRLKPHFSGWKSLVGLCDQAAAQLIHDDSINILFDLSGHTAGNRLSVFAWKPAPVQVSWLGYFATTGMAAMDYFIADEIGVPESNKPQFVEKIKYLPDTRLCFTAPEVSIEVLHLPALANGYITFASFQTMVKAGDDVLALWAEVMRALPNARLRWQCKSFEDTTVADDLRQRLAQFGVHSDRVTLLGSVSREAYLVAHAEVDVILDTFPFPGGTTTCEALWMGVPTLTLAGNTLIARQGASLLTAAGLGDWVAVSKAEYVSKALLLTSDLGKLANLREKLRQQVLASPLFDASRFAKNMENALWEMWNESQPVDSKQNSLSLENNTLSNNLADDKVELALNLNVEIISATKLSENDFWNKSALGLSLKRHLKQDARLSVKVAFENSRGLSDIFNDYIDQADDDAILVFIHDDVWIDEANFTDAVIAGLERFDVIGVAGNRRRLPNQSGWAFIDHKLTLEDKENLSGGIAYSKSAFGAVDVFGLAPAECELLYGVFLATKKSSLNKNTVRFDEQFDFHFYDMDFCRSAKKSGLTLGTWLISLTHQSLGDFGTKHWLEKYQSYLNKWEVPLANNNMIFSQDEVTQTQQLQQAMNDVLQMALQHQSAGDIKQAEHLYLEIIDIQPKHAEANHNLGVIEANLHGALVALPRLELAVQTKPDIEQYWVSYIDALMQAGATETAADALELGQKYGLKSETAQLLAAEFVKVLESTMASSPNMDSQQQHAIESQSLAKLKIDNPMKFIIVAPYYTSKSAGIVVLHELCDSLNKLGHSATMILTGSGQYTISNDASLYGPGLQWYPLKDINEFNDFIRDGIVIYPEIVTGNPLNGKRVVRYLLNSEGFVAKNKMEASEDDFILAFSKLYHKSPHAYLIKLSFNPLFNSDHSVATLDRPLDLTYIGKGASYNQCFVVPSTVEVTRQWPSTKSELASLFKRSRYVYSWDVLSQTNADAMFCGAIPVFLSPFPLESYQDLNNSELGTYPICTATIQGDDLSVNIPDDFSSNLISFKQNYMELVNSYDSRLLSVVNQISQHFYRSSLSNLSV